MLLVIMICGCIIMVVIGTVTLKLVGRNVSCVMRFFKCNESGLKPPRALIRSYRQEMIDISVHYVYHGTWAPWIYVAR